MQARLQSHSRISIHPTMSVQTQTPLFITAVLLLLLAAAAHSFTDGYRRAPTEEEKGFIYKSCNGTDHPRICQASLTPYASFIRQNEGRLVRIAIAVSLSRTRVQTKYLSLVFEKNHSKMKPLEASTLQDCITVFGDSVDSLSDSLKEARHIGDVHGQNLALQIGNVKTWLSAVLTDAETCTDELNYLPKGPMVVDILDRVKKVEVLMDNALALFFNYADHLQKP